MIGATGLALSTLIAAKENMMLKMTHDGMIPEQRLGWTN
jgi:hypothetical protein